ncbi:MAG: response regulator [Spirochaetia bacterium]|jgi:DNA-binding NtrC family response regulator|nr:response regulator [Spirochaetia bacterium]
MPDKILLIVDDQESVCRLLEFSLQTWAENNNVKILTAPSAPAALVILKNNSSAINVLITDQKMPKKSGLELIKIVTEKYPDAVSILMTGYSDFAELEVIIDAGLFAFIKKPWTIEKMTNTVQRALKYAELKYNSRIQ